jgi:hypothetical protein
MGRQRTSSCRRLIGCMCEIYSASGHSKILHEEELDVARPECRKGVLFT